MALRYLFLKKEMTMMDVDSNAMRFSIIIFTETVKNYGLQKYKKKPQRCAKQLKC